jgi:hypothetical protein
MGSWSSVSKIRGGITGITLLQFPLKRHVLSGNEFTKFEHLAFAWKREEIQPLLTDRSSRPQRSEGSEETPITVPKSTKRCPGKQKRTFGSLQVFELVRNTFVMHNIEEAMGPKRG